MKFRTRSDTSRVVPAPVSYPKTRPTYGYTVDKDGKERVVQTGSTAFYEQTQEATQDTLIYNLIDQYERSGNAAIFGSPSIGGFIDTLSMPRDLMEAENIRARARELFEALPLDERKKYGQDFGAFLSDVNQKIVAAQAAAAQTERAAVKEDAVNEK